VYTLLTTAPIRFSIALPAPTSQGRYSSISSSLALGHQVEKLSLKLLPILVTPAFLIIHLLSVSLDLLKDTILL